VTLSSGRNTSTSKGNYSAPAVYEHIPTSSDLATSVGCEYCHNRSVAASNDSNIPNARANVSHYGTKDNLKVGSALTSAIDCFGCHRESSTQSAKWYAIYLPDVEYSKKGTDYSGSCWHCHVGAPLVKVMPTGFHEERLAALTWRCSKCH
jgi:hypothetical protein